MARTYHKRGFLGEFACGDNPGCTAEVTLMLRTMHDNRDVWIGWTWWGGGSWWASDYPFALRPTAFNNPTDRPQMAILRQFFG